MAGAMTWGSELPPRSLKRSNFWLYTFLITGVVALFFATNINFIKADIIYKQGGEYEGAGDWDTSIAIYRRAVELASKRGKRKSFSISLPTKKKRPHDRGQCHGARIEEGRRNR